MSKIENTYPRSFWVANGVELLERAAYYGMFISITLYLTDFVGFNDIWAGIIGGVFSGGLYFLPTFTGAISDKIGYRKAILIAFSLLTIGYATLGLFTYKVLVILALIIAMIGGSFIKSIISATVSKSSTEEKRARAFSIFYAIVNVGSFTGKSIAYPIRLELGVQYVSLYSAGMTLLALLLCYFFYKSIDSEGEGKSISDIWRSLIAVITNMRLLFLVIIITGFWLIQHQLYATMPKYVIRMVGKDASPEFISLVNPLIVVCLVYFVQAATKKLRAITTMNIGMMLMPISALCMGIGHIMAVKTGVEVSIFGLFTMHPIVLWMLIGISFQGLAECFISPRYLEYFSLQAPKGEEGLYLGFSHLDAFLSSIIGFGLSGFLLQKYCPDPNSTEFANYTAEQMTQLYANAHYIWYYFAAIGLTSAIALFIYRAVVNKIDKKKALEAEV